MKTYVAHYNKLTDRKANIEKLFKLASYPDYQFVTNEPTQEFINEFYAASEELWYERVSQLNYGGPISFKKLSKAEISLLYKHYVILNEVADNHNEALILEDDVIFSTSFTQELKDVLNDVPDDWDFIFLGSGCNLRIPKQNLVKDKLCYLKSHPASKCTDSFFITKAAAQKVLSSLMPFVLPIDFELNYHMFLHDMNVYWVEPPIIKQGSQTGLYQSLIN